MGKDSNNFLNFITREKDVAIPWKDAKSICIFGRFAIGECIRIFPLFEAIKKRHPSIKITFACPGYLHELVSGNPFVDELLSVDRGDSLACSVKELLRLSREIRGKFDISISFELFSSVACFFAGVPFRVGVETSLFVHRRKKEDFVNRVSYEEFMERLVELPVSRYKRRIYLDENVEKKKKVGLCLGFDGDMRNWKLDKYLKVVHHIKKEYPGYSFIFFGGPGDVDRFKNFELMLGDDIKIENYVGRLSLKGTCLKMKECGLILSHDCGPMHMAIACGVPTICFFGDIPTPPEPVLPKNRKNIFAFHDSRGASYVDVNKVLKKVDFVLR